MKSGDHDEEEEEERDESFMISFDRIPSRNSSLSCSSRLYYRSSEGIPFQWEMIPGMAKNPPFKETIPPLIGPPPAILSLRLPKPFVEQPKQRLLWLWRKYLKWKNHRDSKKVNKFSLDNNFDFCCSDCGFMVESSCKSSPSSSFSSSSSLVTGVVTGSTSKDSSNQWRLGCGSWNINRIKVAMGRRA